MKKFLIIIGIVAVVFVVGGVLLYFNLENIVNSKKDYLLERAHAEIGRDVTVGDIGVTLGRGIGVRLADVKIADDPAFSTDDFVSARDLTVMVKLLPLLKKKVEVKRLVLNEPVITVIRDENGVFNYQNLAPLKKAEAAEVGGKSEAGVQGKTGADGAAAPAQPARPAVSGAAIPLVLAFADVKDGRFRFIDRQKETDLTVKKLNLTVKNFGLDKEVSIDFGAAVLAENEDVTIEGEVGPIREFAGPDDLVGVPVAVKIEFGPFMVEDIRRIAPAQVNLEPLDKLELGAVSGGLELSGTIGAVEVSQLTVKSAVLGASQPNLILNAKAGPINALETGEARTQTLKLSGGVELSSVSLAKLSALAPRKGEPAPQVTAGGEASLSAGFEGDVGSVGAKLKVDLTNGSLEIPEKFTKPAGVPLTATADVTVQKSQIQIKDSELVMGALSVKASGKVDLSGEKPVLDVDIQSNKNQIADLAPMLPMIAKLAVKGLLSLRAEISGPVGGQKPPKVSGRVDLADGSARLEQMPEPVTNLKAAVRFTDDSAALENTSFRVGRSEIAVQGEAPRLRPLSATYKVSTREAFRADFQAPPAGSAAASAPRPEVLKDVTLEGQVRQVGETVELTGTATSKSGVLGNVDYSDLEASIKSSEDVVLIERFSAKSLGGTIEGNGTFEPKQVPPKFNIKTKVRRINLAEYFTYKLAAVPKVIEGRIDADLDLAGQGNTWEAIQPTLRGSGGALVIEGALLNLNVADELMAGLADIPLVNAGALDRIRQKYPALFSSNKTMFQNLKGDVTIADGKVNSGDILLAAADFELKGNGWFSFDKRMDMNTSIVLSSKLTQDIIKELPIARYIANEQGKIELPVAFTGDVVKPKIVLDSAALTKKLQRSVVDQGVGDVKDQLRDKAKDLLKGFGKKKDSAKPDSTRTP